MRSQGSLLPVGVGVGSASARVAASTMNVCTTVTAPVSVRRRCLARIREPSVSLDGLRHVVGGGGLLVAPDRDRAVLLLVVGDLPVVLDPLQLVRGGVPALGHRIGGSLAGQAEERRVPDLDG